MMTDMERWAKACRPKYTVSMIRGPRGTQGIYLERGRCKAVGAPVVLSGVNHYMDTLSDVQSSEEGDLRLSVEVVKEGSKYDGALRVVAHQKLYLSREADQSIPTTQELLLGYTSSASRFAWGRLGPVGTIPAKVSSAVRWYLDRGAMPTVPYLYLCDSGDVIILLLMERWFPDLFPESQTFQVPRSFHQVPLPNRGTKIHFKVKPLETFQVDPMPEEVLFKQEGGVEFFQGTFSF